MSREYDSNELAALASGGYAHNWFLLFDLPSGLHGYHLGSGLVEYEGVTYVGAGKFGMIEQVDAGVDLSASPIKATLAGAPDSGLDPDMLAAVDSEQYKNRPVTLTQVHFDPATGEIAAAVRWWQGFVDTITHEHTPGGDYVLTANLEARSLDHSRKGFRMRSDSDQRRIDPDDAFFEHAAQAGTVKRAYGRREAGARGGSGGGIG